MTAKPLTSSSLYEQDLHRWIEQQILLLQHQDWDRLDRVHLMEELISMGRRQRQELRNRLSVLIAHLLKWQYQPRQRSRSWIATIRIQRLDIADLLEENPSLGSYLEEALSKAYRRGVLLAIQDTLLPDSTFPSDPPYSLDQIRAETFFPGEPSDLLDPQD